MNVREEKVGTQEDAVIVLFLIKQGKVTIQATVYLKKET